METIYDFFIKSDDSEKLTTNILKIIFILVVLSVTLFFGYYPLMFKIGKNSTRVLSFTNSFTGGVFMGIGFFLLLPQSKEKLESWADESIKDEKWKEMPYCFFISFLAYSFMLFVEKVCFSSTSLIPILNDVEPHGHAHQHDESHSSIHSSEHMDEDEPTEDENEEAFKNVVSTKGRFASFMQIRNLKMSQVQGTANAQPTDRSLMKTSQILTKTFNGGRTDPDMALIVNPQNSDLLMNKDKTENKPFIHSHSFEHSKENAKSLSNITPYLLLVALCLDGLFEGIAIGVQGTWKSVSFVAFAVILNKLSVAFGLGISLKKANTEIKTFIRFIILFSMFCPFGIVLGYLLGEAIFMKGMFLAISAGTFTYVSCSVVIVEEFALTRHRFSKYSLFFLGGLLAAGIAVVGAVL